MNLDFINTKDIRQMLAFISFGKRIARSLRCQWHYN